LTLFFVLIFFGVLITLKIKALKTSHNATSEEKEKPMNDDEYTRTESVGDPTSETREVTATQRLNSAKKPSRGADKNEVSQAFWETLSTIGTNMGVFEVVRFLIRRVEHLLRISRKGLPLRRPFSFG